MILIYFILGLLMGSYSYATAWRILHFKGDYRKVLEGRSKCDRCNHVLSVFDLIPVVSYIFLKGRCRYCGKKFSPHSTYVEIVSVFLFLISGLYFRHNFNYWYIFAVFWFLILTLFLVLSVYDFIKQILPTELVYILYGIVFLGLLSYSFNSGDYVVLKNHLIGMIFSFSIFYIIYQVSSGRWMGGGDVRLVGALGLIVGGIMDSVIMIYIASLCGLIYSGVFYIFKRKLDRIIPFGPFLMLGCFIVFVFNPEINNFLKNLTF